MPHVVYHFTVYLFRKLALLAYKILGAERSSLWANGVIGTYFLKIVYKNINNVCVFSSSEGLKLLLTPKEASLLGLMYFGSINPIETELIKKKLKKGDVFIDIGTYIDGWHSLLAAKFVGRSGKVFAFEPYPKFYKRLIRNIDLNKIDNITAEKIAVSNKNGYSSFFPADNISSFFEKHANAINKNSQPVKVRTTTLDRYVKDKKISKIDLIKIDVECAEMMVLEGAIRTLSKRDAPDLLVEVVNDYLKIAGSTEEQLVKFLKKLEYKTYFIDHTGLKPYHKVDLSQRNLNLYFSKKQI